MRLATLRRDGEAVVAVARDDDWVDLSVAARDLPRTMNELLAGGRKALRRAAEAAERPPRRAVLAGRVTFLPPVPDPQKILCIGLNYFAHAEEAKAEVPEHPTVFARFAHTLVGHRQPLIRPRVSTHFDFEGELVAVIGRRGKHIPAERALRHVAGYTIFNEGSIRDWQMRTSQWVLGKNFDATGGCGPWIVTSDELPPGASGLKLQTRLNGEVVQDSDTGQMMRGVAELVAELSQAMTLVPGDLIVTGTPEGVGFVRKPPLFMQPGDRVEVEIEGIGTLVNPVRAER